MSHHVNGPLSGLKVIEFGQIFAGPYAGMLLADLGADVVKVEAPEQGDGMRGWSPFFENDEGEKFSSIFSSVNRNKRSISINFKVPHERDLLQELCQEADIIIENFRPGVLSKYQLGYEDLSAINPRLVYCSISGYGQEGSFSQKGAFDVTVQAISGIMSVTGDEEGSPAKCGIPIADFVTGLYAAFSIVSAVRNAEQTGKGSYIDCSMLGSILGISPLQTGEYFGTGVPPKRLGTAHPRNAPYQMFFGSDKPFVIAAGTQKLWHKVCELTENHHLGDEYRFSTQPQRAKNQKQLAQILQKTFYSKTADEWIQLFDRHGVPNAPVFNYEDILSHEVVKEKGWVSELPLPNGTKTKTVGFPVKITGHDFAITKSPPKLGEHNEEVLFEWLGYSLQKE